MPGVREKFSAFLDRSAARTFEWGQADCLLEVADWLDLACGYDLANQWRGTYSTEEQANALIGGDIVAFMSAQAATLGIAEAAQPQFGDVGAVTVVGQDKPLAAILLASGRWRMRTAAGIVTARDVTVLKAWSLACRPAPVKRS